MVPHLQVASCIASVDNKGVNPAIIATLGMAIATFLLAIAAFIGLSFTRKQLALLYDQFRIQRSHLVPNITLNGARFEKDEVTVELSNSSDEV
jgi:hypothetical protein